MDHSAVLGQQLPQVVSDLQDLVSLCPDPIIAVNRDGAIVFFNTAAERLLGYTSEEAIMRLSITHIYATVGHAHQIKKQLYANPELQIEGYETQAVSKGGRIIDVRLSARLIVRDGEEIGSIGFFHDLTERKQLEAKLMHMSITDGLTGLHNQRHFLSVLEPEMERAKRYNRPLSLISIDLDKFKQVNDMLGHLEGDNALRFAAHAIQDELRKTDMAFRVGGDEFMVLLLETCCEEAEAIGRRLKASFDQHWALEWNPKKSCPVVSMSMGITQFDQHETPDTLMRRADDLMYSAKKHL
ncbi:MAG: GGDEF domain-containing protein [Burkholderiales bacterium]